MSDDETRRREINGIAEAAEVTACRNLYIITADTTEQIELDNGMVINVIPAWRWLLDI